MLTGNFDRGNINGIGMNTEDAVEFLREVGTDSVDNSDGYYTKAIEWFKSEKQEIDEETALNIRQLAAELF